MISTVKSDFQGKAMSNSRNIIVSTIPKGCNLKEMVVLSFLLFILFLGGKGNCLHARSRYRKEKYFNHIFYQRRCMLTLAGNKHPSVHFFPQGPRLFHLSTGKGTVRSVGNGHQIGYSRADIINININKRSKSFPYRE